MSQQQKKIEPVYVVVPNAVGTVVTQFSSSQMRMLQELENLRKEGKLSDKNQIIKWQQLYAMYQSYLKNQKESALPSPQPPTPSAEPTVKTQEVNTPTNLPKDTKDEAAFTFSVNGVPYSLTDVDPTMSLLSFIRSLPHHTGTKKGCGEGGCGACTVMLQDGTKNYSVNSCLRPLVACQGMNVITTEGIGNSKVGLHPIQTRLADNSGTQCGFCSPGFVMEMYTLLTNNPKPTEDEVEKYFDGHICRCTGYRPIYTAFKTFAANSESKPDEPKKKNCKGSCAKDGKTCKNTCKLSKLYPDIEELGIAKFEKYEHEVKIHNKPTDKFIHNIQYKGVQWITPNSVQECLQYLSTLPVDTTSLVFGHTSRGIYKGWKAQNFIDIQYIEQLKGYSINPDSTLTVGSTNTISEFIDIINSLNQSPSLTAIQKAIFPELLYVLERIASHQVRNAGSIGGNLMLSNKNSFPSDLAIALMGLNATVTAISSSSQLKLDIGTFVNTNLDKYLLTQITFPLGLPGQVFKTFKTSQRNAFSHAIVNSSFSGVVLNNLLTTAPVLAFGNIRLKQIRATSTEQFLQGKVLSDPSLLKAAIALLSTELQPDPNIHDPPYRQGLALSHFYKWYLSLLPSNVLPPNLSSALTRFVRPVTQAEQSYTTDPSEYPVSAPIPKLGGRLQTSGEAQYTADIPNTEDTLHAYFVISENANATIASIDPSAALAVPGVISWISAADIPGNPLLPSVQVPLFASSSVNYNGQPVGLIVATDENVARVGAKLVKITYTNSVTPVATIQQAIQAQSFHPFTLPPTTLGNIDQGLAESDIVFSGTVSLGGQYHLHLEMQTSLATPGENGEIRLDVASQDTDTVQATVSSILNIPRNKVTVEVKRCGGGYGGKLNNSAFIASATALAAQKLSTPVKAVMDIDTNLRMLGRRPDYYVEYTVGIKAGLLHALKIKSYLNSGIGNAEGPGTGGVYNMMLGTVYSIPNFFAEVVFCKTNIPPQTSVRGPGWTPASFVTEHIIEHAASVLGQAPHDFKRNNLHHQGDVTPDGTKLAYWNLDKIFDQLRSTSDYDARYAAVQLYNQQNKWTKKGITIMPVRFGVAWVGAHYPALVSIYGDGSVNVFHGGVEIGQGIDTKVAQGVAFKLGIPLESITVGRHSSQTVPNTIGTGGSITSALATRSALDACDVINTRLVPIKSLLGPNATWQEIVQKALQLGVNLQAQGNYVPSSPPNSPIFQYNSYSCIVQEVFVDVLTGEHQILRSDILFDAGTSLNPAVDIGQVEGGYVMGLGLFLTEQIDIDATCKPVQTNTWEYKPLTALDIPLDWRVALLKDAPNPVGILSSKAVGEPPLSLSASALFAIQHAIADYRNTSGKDTKNYYLNAPAAPAKVWTSAQLDPSELTF